MVSTHTQRAPFPGAFDADTFAGCAIGACVRAQKAFVRVDALVPNTLYVHGHTNSRGLKLAVPSGNLGLQFNH